MEGTIQDEDERRRLESHIADCDRCYFSLRETVLWLQEQRSTPSLGRRALLGSLALMAMLGAILLFLPPWSGSEPDHADLRARLGQALSMARPSARPTPGRLSLETEHAPWVGLSGKAAAPEEDPRHRSLASAASHIFDVYDAGVDDPHPEDRHVLGLADLLSGRPAAAIEKLGRSSPTGEPSAELSSDLAAAYLDLALRENQPQALAQALSWVERALQAEPRLPEARFNRALILERLHLPHQAIRAWDLYLELDASSPWAEEAREHRSELRRRFQSRRR